MAIRNSFLEKDIPYEKLAKLGISRENTLSMPKNLLEPFLSGKLTPLVQAQIRLRNGKKYAIPMKLQMTRDRHGKIHLLTYPVRMQMKAGMPLSHKEVERLRDGKVIRKEVDDNGIRRMQFLQMDRETKSLIKRNAGSLKLPEQMAQLEKVKDIQLGQNQKNAIKEGKPVELEVGDQKVTVGVDNREPQGFKVVNGDMEEWRRQQKIRFDLTHEGFMGYVMTDQNRWEYQQVVSRLEGKELRQEQKKVERQHRHRKSGMSY